MERFEGGDRSLTESELGRLRAHLAGAGGRLYVGSANEGLVLAAPQQAVLVLGPPRSGKTTAVAIPNVLCAPGPVIVTSTKPDLLAATAAARSEVGRCWLFDPTGSTRCPPGLTRLRWSPVAAAATWDESLVMAAAMSRAARPGAGAGNRRTGPNGRRPCWLPFSTPATWLGPGSKPSCGGCFGRISKAPKRWWLDTELTLHRTYSSGSGRPTPESSRVSGRAQLESLPPTGPMRCSTTRPPSTSTPLP